MIENKRSIGKRYEEQAKKYLEQQGYKILICNYRCKKGEIDLIAKDQDCIVFCEVKYRTTENFGNPLAAVNKKKQQVISTCALYYLQEQGLKDISCRFDVVGILKDEIVLVKDAFMYTGR